jgi:hypothetical protein
VHTVINLVADGNYDITLGTRLTKLNGDYEYGTLRGTESAYWKPIFGMHITCLKTASGSKDPVR